MQFQWARKWPRKKMIETGLYSGTLIKGVIPKPRVLSSGARDLPQSAPVHPSQTLAADSRYKRSMRQSKQFFVYIMTNAPKPAVLYTGITGNLTRRVWQHKNKLIPGFTSRYNLTRLVYYERFFYPDAAISSRNRNQGLATQQENKAR
jgi:putative endonuclease